MQRRAPRDHRPGRRRRRSCRGRAPRPRSVRADERSTRRPSPRARRTGSCRSGSQARRRATDANHVGISAWGTWTRRSGTEREAPAEGLEPIAVRMPSWSDEQPDKHDLEARISLRCAPQLRRVPPGAFRPSRRPTARTRGGDCSCRLPRWPARGVDRVADESGAASTPPQRRSRRVLGEQAGRARDDGLAPDGECSSRSEASRRGSSGTSPGCVALRTRAACAGAPRADACRGARRGVLLQASPALRRRRSRARGVGTPGSERARLRAGARSPGDRRRTFRRSRGTPLK